MTRNLLPNPEIVRNSTLVEFSLQGVTVILFYLLFTISLMNCQSPKQLPNFLIILVDDLGSQDVGCYGQEYIQTPNMDQLSQDGMQWTNAYSACPVCSPSRAALLTGKSTASVHFTGHITAIGKHRYPENSRIFPPDDLMYLPHEEILISEALKPLGYKSINIGKWHVGHEGYYPTDQGFDENIGGWTHGSPPSHFYPYKSEKKWNASIPTLHGGNEGEYLTDRLTDEAMRFMEKNRDNPFLLYLAHYAVHTPLEAPKELVEKYRDLLEGNAIDPVYAAMVESVDTNVGRLLHKLDELGLADNTVVIFTSDNGAVESTSNNAPFRRGKGHLYEGGIRVPLIIRWPGVIPHGSTSLNPAISQDLFTTIIDIAGSNLEHEDKLDGRSLVTDFEGNQQHDIDLYWYYPHYSPQAKTPGAAIRSGHYKLIKFYDPDKLELYDLDTDIGEQQNLAEEHPAKARELSAKLDQWLVESETIMHKPNPNYRSEK